MIHSKFFNEITEALYFANTHGIMPISFYSSPTDSHPVNNRVCMVYEVVEPSPPGDHQIDLLKETLGLLRELKAEDFVVYRPMLMKLEDHLNKLEKCLNLR